MAYISENCGRGHTKLESSNQLASLNINRVERDTTLLLNKLVQLYTDGYFVLWRFTSTYVAPCCCDTCDSIFLKCINAARKEYFYNFRALALESMVTADGGVDINVFIKTGRGLAIIEYWTLIVYIPELSWAFCPTFTNEKTI